MRGWNQPSAIAVCLVAWLLAGEAGGAEPAPAPVSTASTLNDLDPPIAERDRAHWAFRKLTRPSPPVARSKGRLRTSIDAFVLARLEAKGLCFSEDANRRTLARRAYLDLVGLPPSPEELRTFLDDPAPDAYERMLDRLLASPHFGERWARHWLDGAGYVDVVGTDNDAGIIKLGENKWRYRDYVVRAFNADKPFARFLTEQIAGDELVDWRTAPRFTPEIRELLEATGFLRVSADDTDEHELNTPDIRHGVLQRTGEILVGNLLGLSFQCARCHDHKYEAVSQRDYYRLLALLQPAFNPDHWLQPTNRQLPDISPAEKAVMDQQNAEVSKEISGLEKKLAECRAPYERKLAQEKLAALPEAVRADARTALDTPADKRTDAQKDLAKKYEAQLRIKTEEIDALLSQEDKRLAGETRQRIAELTGSRRRWNHLQAVYDVGPPTPTRLLRRGEHTRPGAELPPGFLRVLCDSHTPFVAGQAPGGSSGRRLALARWLADPAGQAGALALRVRVNRIWQQLFGKGLVETSDNFGVTGAAPTHPELLEWLASDFAADGGHLKPLLKRIMTSTVYRQASSGAETVEGLDPKSIDPDNRLLWRQRLRRLDSEIVRDSLLATSGTLNPALGGPPVPVEIRPDGSGAVKTNGLASPGDPWRRSLYLVARRNYHLSLLTVFDQPNLTMNCAMRSASAVVLQPLTMLNDGFVLEQAAVFARRIMADHVNSDPRRLITAAFEISLSRGPAETEAQWCSELLDRQRRRFLEEGQPSDLAWRNAVTQLCHTLVNTSEFLYAP